jgi:hypothetical protein
MTDVIRIANCSGFYGDKLSAALEMVEGGPIDVLTGDYLAELTMAILYSQKVQRNTGYVGTFLKQVKQVLKPCREKKHQDCQQCRRSESGRDGRRGGSDCEGATPGCQSSLHRWR